MKKISTNTIDPINQLTLYGYEKYFKSLRDLFEKKKLPHCILLSGPKGIGKSTFVYHFVNSMLSKDEPNEYSFQSYQINEKNNSYNQVINGTHPNFFRISSETPNSQIKIDQSRNLLQFLSKTTYTKNFKVVVIENIEHLNINASNAILKCLEEPSDNTFFFIIHNNSYEILDTIKSRSTVFRIHFSQKEKEGIFANIIKNHYPELLNLNINNSLYFSSPGDLIHQSFLIMDSNIDINFDAFSLINFFLDKFSETKDIQILNYASYFIEKFYLDLSISNSKKLNLYLKNYINILNQINLIKKFNLNEKNSFIFIKDVLYNETK